MTETMIRDLPMQTRLASFEPSRVDAEARTAEVVWTTGATVVRGGFYDEPYNEELSVAPDAVRLGRLNGGAPFLNSHDSTRLDSVIGVVERAWMEGGEGRAVVRFSERADVEPIWRDVQAGIIRNISVGYRVHAFEDVTDRGAKRKTFRAVDWEPYELSAVAIPADAGAGFRAADPTTNECLIEIRSATADGGPSTEEQSMDKSVKAVEPTVIEDTPAAVAEVRSEPAAASVAEVRDIVARAGLPADVALDIAARALPVDGVRAAVIDEIARRAAPIRNPIVNVVREHNAPDEVRAAMATALAARANPRLVKPEGRAAEYMQHSLLDMYGELLEARGVRAPFRNKTAMADMVFERVGPHSTSDFTGLLADASNKTLLAGYQLAAPSYREWAAQRSFNDFKAHNFLSLSDFAGLSEVNEGSETLYGSVSDNKETITPKEFNTGVAITRRALINDDLGAFADFSGAIGMKIAAEENRLVYSLLTTSDGPLLADGVRLFHTSSHGANKATSAAAIGIAALGVGRATMRKQTAPNGGKLNITPAILVCGPDKEVEALQAVSAIVPALIGSVNTMMQSLRVVVDANISGNGWYLFADPAMHPVMVWGYVAGQNGPQTTSEVDFDTKALKVRVGLDFGYGAVDYRGAFYNSGA